MIGVVTSLPRWGPRLGTLGLRDPQISAWRVEGRPSLRINTLFWSLAGFGGPCETRERGAHVRHGGQSSGHGQARLQNVLGLHRACSFRRQRGIFHVSRRPLLSVRPFRARVVMSRRSRPDYVLHRRYCARPSLRLTATGRSRVEAPYLMRILVLSMEPSDASAGPAQQARGRLWIVRNSNRDVHPVSLHKMYAPLPVVQPCAAAKPLRRALSRQPPRPAQPPRSARSTAARHPAEAHRWPQHLSGRCS